MDDNYESKNFVLWKKNSIFAPLFVLTMGNECNTDYTLDLKSLLKGIHKVHYLLDDVYFDSLGFDDVKRGRVEMNVTVDKRAGGIILIFSFEGEVQIICERCLGSFIVPVENTESVSVKFGEEFVDDYESVTIPDDGVFDMREYLFQLIESALPMFRVHPDGECDEHMLELLNNLAVKAENKEETDEVDPRWAALKNILNN